MIFACFASKVIWPRQPAVTHSLLRPTFLATLSQLMPFFTLASMIISVTSLRFTVCSSLSVALSVD